MRFKVDENLPAEAADLLAGAGYDASSVLDQDLRGARDRDLAALCQGEERVLVTLDLGFGDIRAYPPQSYPGIIVLRLARQDALQVLQTLDRLLRVLDHQSPEGALWVVEADRIRVRQ